MALFRCSVKEKFPRSGHTLYLLAPAGTAGGSVGVFANAPQAWDITATFIVRLWVFR